MATVKGLTIEISASANKFNKQIKEMTSAIKTTKTEAQELKKQLKIEFEADKLLEAQKLSQQALDETRKKASLLAERLKYLESLNGGMNSAEYLKVQEQIAKTQTEVVKLEKSLEELNKLKLDNLTSNITEVGNGLTNAGRALAPISALAAGTIAGLGTIGKSAAATGAEIDDLSLRLGVSAEKIQEWQYVAVQTGVDIDVFNKALIKARAAVLDFSNGKINESTKAIAGLNLNLASFKTQEDMFDGVIEALSNMEDKALQASYANEIFGDKIAYQLLPFLNAGSEAINVFKEEFRSMSYLTNEQVSSLATLDDTLFRVKERFKNIALQIGVSLIPIITKLTTIIETKLVPKLELLMNWFCSLSTETIEFGLKALTVVALVAPLLMILGKVTLGVLSIIKVVSQLSGTLTALQAHPIIAIITAVVALLMILYTTNERFREGINKLVTTIGQLLSPILNVIITVLKTLLDAVMPIIDVIGTIIGDVLIMLLDQLSPIVECISLLFNLISPLIKLALIPLQNSFKSLEIPLKMIAMLLEVLMPIFNSFANVVKGVFSFITKMINIVLGGIENAINWCIDKANKVIDGINKMGGWAGIDIKRIEDVSLKLDTGNIDEELENTTLDSNTKLPENTGSPYDSVEIVGSGTTNNYDYSTSNTTQNIEVVIQNYAEEVDVDDLVRQINIKLAEVM